jgi:hypothetical protein
VLLAALLVLVAAAASTGAELRRAMARVLRRVQPLRRILSARSPSPVSSALVCSRCLHQLLKPQPHHPSLLLCVSIPNQRVSNRNPQSHQTPSRTLWSATVCERRGKAISSPPAVVAVSTASDGLRAVGRRRRPRPLVTGRRRW